MCIITVQLWQSRAMELLCAPRLLPECPVPRVTGEPLDKGKLPFISADVLSASEADRSRCTSTAFPSTAMSHYGVQICSSPNGPLSSTPVSTERHKKLLQHRATPADGAKSAGYFRSLPQNYIYTMGVGTNILKMLIVFIVKGVWAGPRIIYEADYIVLPWLLRQSLPCYRTDQWIISFFGLFVSCLYLTLMSRPIA